MFWFTILILIVLGFILTNNIQESKDIGLWDETLYLGNGVSFFTKRPPPYWGPIYSLWYYILNLFTNDHITLYYINLRLLVILLPIILSVYMFKITENVIISFFYSYLFLISSINFSAWPKVSHFALILAFVTLILIKKVRNFDKRLIIACIGTLFISYVRPEFVLAFLIFLVMLSIQIIKKRIRTKNLIIVIATTIVLVFTLGIPYSSNRSLTAFGQAYIKYFPNNETIGENYRAEEWMEVLNKDFNYPITIFDIINNNTGRFLKHLQYNIKSLLNIQTSFKDLILPQQLISFYNPINSTIFVSLVCTIPFLLIAFTDKNQELNFEDSISDLIFLIFCSLIFILPPFIDMILISPRSHYFLLLIPLFYSLLSTLFIPIKIKKASIEALVLLFLIVLSFLLLPILSSGEGHSDLKNFKTVKDIRGLQLKKDVIMLENNGGLVNYLSENYRWININSKTQSFNKFLLKNKINFIVDPPTLTQSIKLKNDSTWYEFLDNPQIFEFREKDLDSGKHILIKEDLLPD